MSKYNLINCYMVGQVPCTMTLHSILLILSLDLGFGLLLTKHVSLSLSPTKARAVELEGAGF